MEIKLGQSIRRLRKEAGYTQEQLAEALRVTTGAVYKWESGRAVPELELLVEIAEFFETSVDALLDYGWEKTSMGQAAEKLRQYAVDRKLEEGMRFAEQSATVSAPWPEQSAIRCPGKIAAYRGAAFLFF